MGGIVGEDGPSGIAIGPTGLGMAFAAFQDALRALRAQGVLLAIASKNNEADAFEVFDHHPGYTLREKTARATTSRASSRVPPARPSAPAGARVGGGGNGKVYRAEHRELRRIAVIKVMLEERRLKDSDAEARFRREAQLASQLQHPNAAYVYDFGIAAAVAGDHSELMWIAMEFVDGATFARWLERHGPMSLSSAVQFFEPLIWAVDAAHQCGIVHRDLKPSHVMVIEDKGALIPKLIDFAIAKGTVASSADDAFEQVERSRSETKQKIRGAPSTNTAPDNPTPAPEHQRKITRSGVGIGSRAYMSPEREM